jgi:hypothetical protein
LTWGLALHLAARTGLVFGRDVVFPYGPLGFLSQPLAADPLTGPLSIAFSLAVWVTLAGAVFAAARRVFSAWAAFLLSYVVLCLPVQVADALVVLAFFGVIWALEREPAPGSKLWVVGAGVYGGVVALVKLNNGVATLALLTLAAWRLRPGRFAGEAILFGSFGVTTSALWLLTGNPIGVLPHWLDAMTHVASGYQQTMALDSRARLPQYVWAFGLLLAGSALLALHLGRRRPALWLAALVYVGALLKEGFVRHDGHDLTFFAGFGVGVLAFRWSGRRERLLAAATVLVAAGAVIATPEVRFGDVFRPAASTSAALDDLRLVVDPSRLHAEISAARAKVREQLDVSPQLLPLLRGRTVDVVPVEGDAAWAYGLHWRPPPVIQDVTAFDAYLDRLNAAAVARRGPDRILQHLWCACVDLTHPLLEAPATALARLCHYSELRSVGDWAVLARTANRCGTPRKLGSLTAAVGRPVPVPAAPHADELVYARVTLARPLAQRVEETVLKPIHLPHIVLGSVAYRFVSASAHDPLVLRLPATSGVSPWFGGRVDYANFTLQNVPSPFKVDFYAVPLRGHAMGRPPTPPTGRISPGAIVLGGRRVPLGAGAATGSVDHAFDWGSRGGVIGKATDALTGRPADVVAIFVDGRLATLGRPGSDSEYRLAFPLGDRASVRVFAVAGARATELAYGADDPWPHR